MTDLSHFGVGLNVLKETLPLQFFSNPLYSLRISRYTARQRFSSRTCPRSNPQVSFIDSRLVLLQTISVLSGSVRFVAPDRSETQISPEHAARLILSRPIEGRFCSRSGRLKYIREKKGEAVHPHPFSANWRNSEAAVLQPYAVTGKYTVGSSGPKLCVC